MKIIVLTPIKNEEWILDTFLKSCSLFADHILIADQNSTDKSVEIALGYKNVTLIKNDSIEFNEADRQKLLINKAREFFGLGNFLLALDADEIITGNSILSNDWKTIKESATGTVFLFDKPTPLFSLNLALRYGDGFPLGFIDDGTEHSPALMHSARIPIPINANFKIIKNISFLHLCFGRENIQFSKNRYYCVLEKIQKKRNLKIRRLMYSFFNLNDYAKTAETTELDKNWFKFYDDRGVDLRVFKEETYYYMDFEVLKMFNKYGLKLFYNEPIWRFDWELCRLEGIKRGIVGIPKHPIVLPCKIYTNALDLYFNALIFMINKVREFRKRILFN